MESMELFLIVAQHMLTCQKQHLWLLRMRYNTVSMTFKLILGDDILSGFHLNLKEHLLVNMFSPTCACINSGRCTDQFLFVILLIVLGFARMLNGIILEK